MKIGIDISQTVYGTGASVYTKKLVENLLNLDSDDKFLLFGGSLRRRLDLSNFYQQVEKHNNSELKIYPVAPSMANFLWNRLHKVNIETFTGSIDVFHSSDWTQPPSKAYKVTTVHDLAPILLPNETPMIIRQVHSRRLDWVKSEVSHIIVPSQATKNDLIMLGFKNNLISVIPEAPCLEDFSYIEAEEANSILKKYKIEGKYLLSIGLNPRKNTARVIQAFHLLKSETKVNNLVIVGNGTLPHGINHKKIITTGHISDKELYVLIKNAAVFVYASLYEGFGIPILESFRLGVPVVTSNLSSMPEVAGSAAVLVDPKSVESIKNGILEALNNKKALVVKGFDRVKKFSWESNAKETLGIYHKFKKNR